MAYPTNPIPVQPEGFILVGPFGADQAAEAIVPEGSKFLLQNGSWWPSDSVGRRPAAKTRYAVPVGTGMFADDRLKEPAEEPAKETLTFAQLNPDLLEVQHNGRFLTRLISGQVPYSWKDGSTAALRNLWPDWYQEGIDNKLDELNKVPEPTKQEERLKEALNGATPEVTEKGSTLQPGGFSDHFDADCSGDFEARWSSTDLDGPKLVNYEDAYYKAADRVMEQARKIEQLKLTPKVVPCKGCGCELLTEKDERIKELEETAELLKAALETSKESYLSILKDQKKFLDLFGEYKMEHLETIMAAMPSPEDYDRASITMYYTLAEEYLSPEEITDELVAKHGRIPVTSYVYGGKDREGGLLVGAYKDTTDVMVAVVLSPDLGRTEHVYAGTIKIKKSDLPGEPS